MNVELEEVEKMIARLQYLPASQFAECDLCGEVGELINGICDKPECNHEQIK